ncbi:hypothetical protein GOM49_17350 [Clostridium bovifaecis]|uniref:NADH:quinone oxidoreductase/Mrp antiporter transmembrane domain-containing protein n=1 Tax=Clostridium bovifaecis TaxID=2184719 RepID=A0A6I6F7Z8_9CLOT|nr:hypothetical protein GOM49_17350 [Clostridium bovifaecis]
MNFRICQYVLRRTFGYVSKKYKRILAYSSMSQIGYILVGIGLMGILKEHRTIAIYGTLYHIINHAIFKVLLFMGAGIIYMVLHELSINKIGGFGRDKKILKVLFFIGLCAIIGMPGFNGFASKTLLHQALSEAHHMYGGNIFVAAEVVFTLSSCFTVAYLLKIFIAVFVEKSSNDFNDIKSKITVQAIIPMVALAGVILYIGMQPDKLIGLLNGALQSFDAEAINKIHFYSFDHIKSSASTIFLGVLVYITFVRKYLRKGTKENWHYENTSLQWFNLERDLYKPITKHVFNVISIVLKGIDQSIIKFATIIGNGFKAMEKVEIEYNGPILKVKEANKEQFKEGKKEIFQNKETLYNVKEAVNSLGNRFNSVTYSIFIFGVVLVICLVVLIK